MAGVVLGVVVSGGRVNGAGAASLGAGGGTLMTGGADWLAAGARFAAACAGRGLGVGAVAPIGGRVSGAGPD